MKNVALANYAMSESEHELGWRSAGNCMTVGKTSYDNNSLFTSTAPSVCAEVHWND